VNSGIYTAYSGLKAHAEALEITANNLANLNTVGFKRDRAFSTQLRESIQDSGFPSEIGLNVNRSVRTERNIDYSDGDMLSTGRNLDVAIRGDGFLTVQTANGERYTRNGNLHLDSNSTLRTADGNPVIGVSGRPVTLGPGEVYISDNGGVHVNGEEMDQLKIVVFQDRSRLEKEGGTLFYSKDGGTPALKTNAVVRSGYLEQGNVNAIRSMVEMISTMRHFESIQRSVAHEMNDMNSKVIERLGRT
jgi:flagellar basal-body rod protein FlgF